MAKVTKTTSATAIGSGGMPNPRLRTSVPEGLHERACEEADRLGITLNDLVLFALIAALEAPRRLEDMKLLQERFEELEARLSSVEGKAR